MNKTEELAKFKKANKVRREQIAKKAGFETVESYTNFLNGESKKSPVKKAEKFKEVAQPIDVVVAFDSTGSMAAYLSAVRKHVVKTIGDMFSNTPNLKMKIVVFGDYTDMEDKDTFGKAYQQSDLTDNQNYLVNFVKQSKDTSGGDSDEFYELVIKKITEETPWREGSKRSVIFIADYTPHLLGYSFKGDWGEYYVRDNQIDWKVEAKKAADLGIQFDTFKIIPHHSWYNELSKITGGVCMNFSSQKKMEEVIRASTYARGATDTFNTMYMAATASGDEELIGAYKSLSTLTDK